MIKVAVLDDYQEIFQQIIDIKKYKEKYSDAFIDKHRNLLTSLQR